MTDVTPARGRPRDEALSERILAETRAQLRTVGFTSLRVADIASAVRCGVSTIYRRWPTREHLIAAAIANRPDIEVDLTGDAEIDLRNAIAAVMSDLGVSPNVMTAAMSLVQTDEDIARALRHVISPLRVWIADQIAGVVGDGHTGVAALVDAVPGTMIFRTVLMGEQVDPEQFADEMLDLVRSVRG